MSDTRSSTTYGRHDLLGQCCVCRAAGVAQIFAEGAVENLEPENVLEGRVVCTTDNIVTSLEFVIDKIK